MEVITHAIDPRGGGHLGVTLGNSGGDGGAVRVEAAHPSDLIYKAGIRVGDIVRRVNKNAVSTSKEALDLMCSLKSSFDVEVEPCPERKKIFAQRARAVDAAWTGMLCSVPSATVLGSIEVSTFYGGLVLLAVLAVNVGFYRTYGTSALQGGRTCTIILALVDMYLVVSAGQEVRRCVTNLCDLPTMYGSRQDCLSVCSSPYAALHWPAVAVSVLSSLAAGRAAWRMHMLCEAVEALPKFLQGEV